MNNNFSSNKMNDNILNAIYGYYVKYDKLTQLINTNYAGSNATTLNLFIDVNNILCKIQDYSLKNGVFANNYLVIMAGLINMAAHYRFFFRTRYGCHTKIWLINAVGNKTSSLYDKSYNYPNVDFNICRIDSELMSTTCTYIPDVMYCVCDTEFSAMVMHVLSQEEYAPGTQVPPSIAITKDDFAFQLATSMNYDIRVLRPSKYKGEDNSYIVNSNNALQIYAGSSTNIMGLPSSVLPVYMAMTRVPSRSIKSLYKAPTAIKILSNAVAQNTIFLKYPWDPEHYFTQLAEASRSVMPNMPNDIPLLAGRFKAIESVYFLPLAYKHLPNAASYIGMVNLYDPKGMQEINEKYFKDTPLDLEVF